MIMSILGPKSSCLLASRCLPTTIQRRTSVRQAIHRYVEPDKYKKDMLAATQPYFKKKYLLPSETCRGNLEVNHELHPLDKIYANELVEEIRQNDFVLFIQHNYTPFQSERVYKNTLTKSGGIFRSHKNGVYKDVFKRLETDQMVQQLFVTRNSLVIGKIDHLARCVIALKRMPQFLLLGGCIQNEVYNYEQLQSIGSNPSLDLCRANLVSILETPAIDLSSLLERIPKPENEE